MVAFLERGAPVYRGKRHPTPRRLTKIGQSERIFATEIYKTFGESCPAVLMTIRSKERKVMKIQPYKIERPGEDVVGRKVLPAKEKYAEYAHGMLLQKEQRQQDRAWIWGVVKVGLLLSPIWVTALAIIGIATRSDAE